MEEIIVSKLISQLLSNETPSNWVLTAFVAYMLWMFKQHKKQVKSIGDDVELIKKHLGITNVIELPSNPKSKK